MRQCSPRLLQQFGQGVLAAFQGRGVVGLQDQHALVQGQRDLQFAVRLCGRGFGHQPIDAGMRSLAPAQLIGDSVGVGPWHLQFSGQRERLPCGFETIRVDVRARLRQRGFGDPAQTRTRLAAIRVQGQRRFETLARAGAVGGAQSPSLQGDFRLVEQALHAHLRPHQVGQWLPERHHERGQQKQDRRDPAPVTAIAPGRWRRRGRRSTEFDFLQPVRHRLDPVAGRLAGLVVRSADHRDRIIVQPERRASSTPGSASSLPSRFDNWP